MYNMQDMCPYCYYWCPYLSRRMIQERRCMSTAELYDIFKKLDGTETYYISFNYYYTGLNGFYHHIHGVAGGPKYFIFNATNSKGKELLLDGHQVCSMNLKGPRESIKVSEMPSEVSSEPSIETISQFTERDPYPICWYNGQQFSQGSKVKMNDGSVKWCNGGYWQ